MEGSQNNQQQSNLTTFYSRNSSNNQLRFLTMPLEKQCTPKTKKKIIQNLKDWDLFIRDQGTKLQKFEDDDLDLESSDSVKSFNFDL